MYCLFIDLDGVLVDFDGGVERLTGKRPAELNPRQMWPRLAKAGGFYEHLDWMPDGPELWHVLRKLNPTILTGLPLGNWAEPQKRSWCARELGADVPVEACLSRHKAERARELTPEAAVPVLIDDRQRLREAWTDMGGVFIHHKMAAESILAVSGLKDSFVRSLR